MDTTRNTESMTPVGRRAGVVMILARGVSFVFVAQQFNTTQLNTYNLERLA